MALKLVKEQAYDAVVLHRAIGADSESLVRCIRREKPHVPLLALSGIARRKQLVTAGATEFLNYDAWLMVGKPVAEMISPQSNAPFTPSVLPSIAATGLLE